MDPHILKQLNIERHAKRPCILLTDLSDGRDRLIKKGDMDDIAGRLGDELRKVFSSGKSAQVTIAGRDFFLNLYQSNLRIVVIGAVHIAQALAQFSDVTGYALEIIDPRSGFAAPERFGNTELYTQWPEERFADAPLDAFTALVVVTHDPKIDDEALIAALNANCLYIGALGGRKSNAKRVQRLLDAGMDEEKIARIHAPIGLDIGAANPSEIAVAIMAEIIAVFRLQQ